MKASPFSSLLISSWLIVLSIGVVAQSGQYTVQVDAMTAQDAAASKVRMLKAQGQSAYWLKSNVPGQGIRYRVRIGRFPTRVAAQNYGMRLKQQGITSDFFVALFEGASSPLGSAEPVQKPAPPPVLSATPKPVPAENKTVENDSVPPTAQRQREVKPTQSAPALLSAPVNTTNKPVVNVSPAATGAKPTAVPPTMTPVKTTPSNSPRPQSAPITPAENKPLQSKPLNPALLEELKPPRDKKAENMLPTDSTQSTTSATVAAVTKTETPVDKGITGTPVAIANSTGSEATTPAPPANSAAFQRFEERAFGYSFEHPTHWSGGRLNVEELQAQRIDAGAVFRSQEDVAFMNAIWNSLKNANSPAYDNNLIVDLVIKSLSSGTGLQGLNEISRRMVQEDDQIKTFVDLRTLFRQPRASSPLEFQGKAVIIRANTGILLVVSFYSKDSAPAMVAAAERIISSARVP